MKLTENFEHSQANHQTLKSVTQGDPLKWAPIMSMPLLNHTAKEVDY